MLHMLSVLYVLYMSYLLYMLHMLYMLHLLYVLHVPYMLYILNALYILYMLPLYVFLLYCYSPNKARTSKQIKTLQGLINQLLPATFHGFTEK